MNLQKQIYKDKIDRNVKNLMNLSPNQVKNYQNCLLLMLKKVD